MIITLGRLGMKKFSNGDASINPPATSDVSLINSLRELISYFFGSPEVQHF